MIAEKILGKANTCSAEKEPVTVSVEWFEADKKRLSKIAADGTELGICIGETLSDGDIIAETEDKSYVVEIAPTRLIKVTVSSMYEMGKLGFELGNRHLSLKITENTVFVPYDEPTFLYLKKLGFAAEEVTEKFSDYIVCKAHGASSVHEHGHEHESHHHHHE